MIEGTIFDIKKFAVHDGPGIRTTVFFKGCPLNCLWCHNPESRNGLPETICVRSYDSVTGNKDYMKQRRFGKIVSVDEVMKEVLQDEIFYDQSGGGVSFSGGEPLFQIDFLQALLQACKDNRLETAVDTSGFAEWGDFEKIINLVDLFLYDIKIMDEQKHIAYTGVSNEKILSNLKQLAEKNCRISLRIPLIPGITDGDENLSEIKSFIEQLDGIEEICLLPYNRLGEDKFRKFGLGYEPGSLLPQEQDFLNKTAETFRSGRYRVKIGG